MREGGFRLSQPLIGKISKTWGVTAVQAVSGDDGRIVGAVGMAIELRNLQPFGAFESKDIVAGIIARPGVVVARSVDPERWIGKDVSDEPGIAAMLAQNEGTLRGNGLDQRDRLWAFRPVSGTNWIAYGSVDAAAAVAPAHSRALVTLLIIAVDRGRDHRCSGVCGAADRATDRCGRGSRTCESERLSRCARGDRGSARSRGCRRCIQCADRHARTRHTGARGRAGEAAAPAEPPRPAASDHSRDRRASRSAQHLPGRDPQPGVGSAYRFRLHLHARRRGEPVDSHQHRLTQRRRHEEAGDDGARTHRRRQQRTGGVHERSADLRAGHRSNQRRLHATARRTRGCARW